MGLFSAFRKQPTASTSGEDLKHALFEIAAFGASEDESAHDKANMDKVLAHVEAQVNDDTSSMLLYWLGIA